MRKHVPLLLLLLAFVIVTQIYRWALLPFEGPDETEHIAYALKVRETGQLPDPDADWNSLIAQEAAQPPLYYVTIALWSRLRHYDALDAEPVPNPWKGSPAPFTSADNRNFFMMSPYQHALTNGEHQVAAADVWMRHVSLGYGVLAVVGVYLAGLALFSRGWALLAAMGVAFNPQILQASAVVGNDIGSIGFGALILAGALWLYDDPHNLRLLILTGSAMGLGSLAKVNGLTLWAIPALSVGLGWWNKSHPPTPSAHMGKGNAARRYNTVLRSLLMMIGVAAVIGGWWYVRGLILYDDPFGLQPHLKSPWGLDDPMPLRILADFMPEILQWTWANLGWRGIQPEVWGYALPVLLVGLGAVGWVSRKPDGRALVLVVMVMLGFVAIWRWSRVSSIVPGRLLLPYFHAFVLLVVWGLQRWGVRARLWMAGALGGMAIVLGVGTLYAAFAPPQLLDSAPDSLEGPVLDFGGPRFLGFQVDQHAIHTGDEREFMLCWQAPASDELVAVPYAFALHIVGPENTVVGRRESYPGMGRYTLWQPAGIFCDKFGMEITGTLESGRVYGLALALFDFATGESLTRTDEIGTKVPTTFIGSMWSPALPVDGDELAAAPYQFGDVALIDYDVVQNGDSLQLAFVWATHAAPRQNYNLFIHLIDDAGTVMRQVDPVLGGDRYPAWAWGQGERIRQTVTLEELPAGDYRIAVGIYQPETFVRLLATAANGERLADDAVVLETIRVE